MTTTPTDPIGGGGGDGEAIPLPKQVFVAAKADLPAPSAGDITLLSDTEYLFTDDVSIGTDRLILSANTLIDAQDSSLGSLTYTGTGDMITAVGISNKIARITLNCPNGNLLNVDGSSTGIFQLFDMTVGIVKNIGTFTALSGSQITNVAFGSITGTGLLFAGAHGIFLSSGNIANISAGTLFDLGTATFDGLSITSSFPDVSAGAVFLTGMASSGNINTGGFATIQDVIQTGLGTPLSGITSDDDQWQFANNSMIPDTKPAALLSFNTPTTTTADQNTPTLVAGTWTVEGSPSQFTATAAGRLTYTGVKDIEKSVSIGTSIQSVSGGSVDITIYLALNGSIIANSSKVSNVSPSTPGTPSIMWEIMFSTGDFVELFVENNTNGIGLQLNDASNRID